MGTSQPQACGRRDRCVRLGLGARTGAERWRDWLSKGRLLNRGGGRIPPSKPDGGNGLLQIGGRRARHGDTVAESARC